MGFYDDRILPHAIDFACSSPPIMELREKVVPLAEGEVLEIGMGSGINLSLYIPDKVRLVWGLEPSQAMREKARPQVESAPFEVRWLDLPGEEIPLEDESVDTVLLTYTLCTIPDWHRALKQMRRVLRPGGRLLFCEHGRAPDRRVEKWQDRLTPVWKHLAGGCHLNRPIAEYIESAGFVIESLDNLYARKTPKFAGYMYYGWASRGVS
ncbi:MAG: class I SAM-dependent methyltransferase [Ketobacteraceae bacterium]|nr:class I SAM-dependent methyltransferase [Ketobacteraceae bacterium]